MVTAVSEADQISRSAEEKVKSTDRAVPVMKYVFTMAVMPALVGVDGVLARPEEAQAAIGWLATGMRERGTDNTPRLMATTKPTFSRLPILRCQTRKNGRRARTKSIAAEYAVGERLGQFWFVHLCNTRPDNIRGGDGEFEAEVAMGNATPPTYR